ncbi:MAG: long-chain-fatty-acid--CoA ligase [Acetobacteraceae bacterium]|nr:long-chain-fatty-acid--CoA ligase [Acetobacteraceae bacterium]
MARFEAARSLADIFRAQARAQPQATAQIFRDRVTIYGALDRRASQVANGLIALGARPGTRVGYLGKNSDLYFELLLGALKANVVLVPVHWRLAPREAATILADAGVGILFVGTGFASMVEAIAAAGHAAKEHIGMDGNNPAWPNFAAWRDAQPDRDPVLPIAPEDTAVQLYTSGTTGLPKGVELTNRNFLASLTDYGSESLSGVGPADVVLTCMPVFHAAGTYVGMVPLAHGCTNVVMEEVSIPGLLDLIPRHRVTFAVMVPAVILALVQHPDAPRTDFRSLRRLIYGASPIAEDTVRRVKALLPGVELWQVYGATETCASGTTLPPAFLEGPNSKIRSCGRPYRGVDVRVVGPLGDTLPTGEVGEIVIRCAAVMKGYWNNPKATRAAFFDGGWLRTGDAGYFDADGFLYIHDRIKDMIISGAENIYPAEVENALMDHPAIADAAVIGVPDERWGEAVMAIVVLKPGEGASQADIIAFIRARIAGYKLPKSIDFVPALPRNPSGKILRRELRAPYWAGRTRQVN